MARTKLLVLYDAIAQRAQATTEARAWWPCKRGCDTCCRRLADIPRMTRVEWELLREGLATLPTAVRASVDAKIAALAAHERHGTVPRHVTCPMLDEEQGACLVYAHRPAACRTYGFYVERGAGLHCALVTEAVEAHPEDAVVWGNEDGVHATLAKMNAENDPPRQLTAWLASSLSEASGPEDPRPEPSSPSSSM